MPVSWSSYAITTLAFPPDRCNSGCIENRVINAVTFQAIHDRIACRQLIIEVEWIPHLTPIAIDRHTEVADLSDCIHPDTGTSVGPRNFSRPGQSNQQTWRSVCDSTRPAGVFG